GALLVGQLVTTDPYWTAHAPGQLVQQVPFLDALRTGRRLDRRWHELGVSTDVTERRAVRTEIVLHGRRGRYLQQQPGRDHVVGELRGGGHERVGNNQQSRFRNPATVRRWSGHAAAGLPPMHMSARI